MLEPLHNLTEIARLRELIDSAKEIVITCHVSPDGDAIGSSLAMQRVMSRLKKIAWVVTPDLAPRSLGFLPGVHDIIAASQKPARARELMARADLVVCLDFNAIMRVDKLGESLRKSPAPKVLIDHHLYPESFAEVIISRPEASSTCYLLYNVLCALGMDSLIDREAAECIYTGMMTDTGGFTYNSNDPGLYLVIAALLERGFDKDRIYKLVFDTSSETRLRLCGYALYKKMMVFPEHKAALITLSCEELAEFNYCKGDTESLVNRPLAMPGVVWSVFLREDEHGFVKVSTRSKGHFPVNKVCERHFGGGGHENAAGGEFYGSLDEAVAVLLEAMPEYDRYLPKSKK